MGPSPGPARARPGPVLFSRDRARNSKKGPSSTQARDRFLEKGLENWDFYVVKNTGSSRLGIELLWRAWARARLEIDIQGSGSARDRFFRARPITSTMYLCTRILFPKINPFWKSRSTPTTVIATSQFFRHLAWYHRQEVAAWMHHFLSVTSCCLVPHFFCLVKQLLSRWSSFGHTGSPIRCLLLKVWLFNLTV